MTEAGRPWPGQILARGFRPARDDEEGRWWATTLIPAHFLPDSLSEPEGWGRMFVSRLGITVPWGVVVVAYGLTPSAVLYVVAAEFYNVMDISSVSLQDRCTVVVDGLGSRAGQVPSLEEAARRASKLTQLIQASAISNNSVRDAGALMGMDIVWI